MKLTTNGLGLLIGDFLLPYYGAMILCGLIVACLIGYLLVRHHKMEARILAILAATGLLGGLVGAKLLYVLQNWKEIDFSGSEWQSGFVFYGGLIGALITLLFVGKFTKIPVLSYLRIAVACIPVAHGFGRIGCHLVGCCYGIEYNGFLAKRYTNSMVPGLNGRSVFPVQMTEAICLFIIGIVLIIYVWKSK